MVENRISCFAQDFHFRHPAHARLGGEDKQADGCGSGEWFPFTARKRRAQIPAARQVRYHHGTCPWHVSQASKGL